jgi:UPF0716 protein FxsA
MFPVLLLIFLIVPVIEIYVLIQIGQVIGALWTVLFVVLTAVIGVQLLRMQGLATLARAQQRMHSGQMPAGELLEGIGLVVAGALLLTPGFVTDALGFLLLIPAFRRWVIGCLRDRLAGSGTFTLQGRYQQREKRPEGELIEDVEYRIEDDPR